VSPWVWSTPCSQNRILNLIKQLFLAKSLRFFVGKLTS